VATDRKGIQSIEIGYKLLEQFLHAPGPRTLKSLAADAGMSPTKAYFYLTSFVRVGLLSRNVEGRYVLGSNLLALGLKALSEIDVLEVARPAMLGLRDALDGDVFLSVWANHGPTIVYRVLGTRWTAWEIRVGAVLPPLGATGKAFLAYFPTALRREIVRAELRRAQPQDPWYRQSEKTTLALCDEVHKHGIGRGGSNVVPGFTSVASPIFGAEGNVSAVITVNGEASRFSTAYNGRNARLLLNATRRLSHQIGSHP
jgi:DNA-binding IclR family transcriptional regulator